MKKYRFQIVLFVLVLFFFRKFIFTGGFIFGVDTIIQNFPFKYFLAGSLHAGHLPLWCWNIGSGYPLYAESQGSFFYPFNLVFLILPPLAAFNFLLLLSFLTAALSMYYYCRKIGVGEAASYVSAAVFSFGAFMVLHLDNSNLIFAASWLPLGMLFIELFFRKEKSAYIFLAGGVFSLQLLAGFPQMAVYSFFLYAVYFLFRLASSRKKILRPLVLALAAAVIGIGIGSVQLLPTLKLKKTATYKDFQVYRWSPSDLLTLVNPYVFGTPWTKNYKKNPVTFALECHYIGLVSLVLAAFAAGLFMRSALITFFLFLSGFIIILLSVPPVYKIVSAVIPWLLMFRFPARLFLLVQFSLAVLAGFGLELVKNKKVKIAAMLVLTMDIFYFAVNYNSAVKKEQVVIPPASAVFIKKDKGDYRIFSLRHFKVYEKMLRKSVAAGEPFSYGKFEETLCPDSNLLWNIPSADLYLSLYMHRLARFSHFIEDKFIPGARNERAEASAVKLLGMENVKYILSAAELESPFLELKKTVPAGLGFRVHIYENRRVMPKIFLVHRAVFLSDISKMGGALEKLNPGEEVILEESPGKIRYKKGTWKTEGISYGEGSLRCKLESQYGGFLVFSDTYYPGWQAFVDGRPTHIFRANYRFKAIQVGKGRHNIEFRFRPGDFRYGILLTAFSLAVFILLLAFTAKRHK